MGLVGNGKVISRFSKRQNHPYLLGQIGLVGNNSPSTVRLEQLVPGIPLPIRSNRISWKLKILGIGQHDSRGNHPLPIRSNRISWKRACYGTCKIQVFRPLPIRSNRIIWKRNWDIALWCFDSRPTATALPIRSNRISWKTEKGFLKETLFLINCVKYILTKIDKNVRI